MSQNVGVLAAHEIFGRLATKIGEVDGDDVVVMLFEYQRGQKLRIGALRPFLEVPCALLAPAVADRTVRRDELAALGVEGNGFPVGVVFLAELAVQIVGPQEPARDQPVAFLVQPNQHREVAVLAAVFLEILGLPVEVEFPQDHMAHGHCKRAVGALFRGQPDVAEFRGFGIVGADNRGLCSAIACLGIEMRIRRTRLRHV